MRTGRAAMVLVGLVAATRGARAESPPSANAVFVELVGSAPIGSVNYERLLASRLGVRLGVGYLRATTFLGNDLDRVELPVVFGVTLGDGADRLELGAGLVPGVLTGSGAGHRVEVPATAVLGYRHAPQAGGFLFRASFTPLVDLWDTAWSGNRFIPLGGVSFGYLF